MSAPWGTWGYGSAPSGYSRSFMTRLINSLELDKQRSFYAASVGLTNAVDQAEATAWFMA